KALLETGLTEATPVSMRLKDVKLKTALKLMLAPLGLTYQIEDDVLLLTSPQNNAKMVERAYPVGDLILPVNRLNKPIVGDATNPLPDPNNPAAPAGANGLSTSASLESSSGNPSDLQNLDFSPLIQVITASVAPGTWKVYDGKGGTLPIG